jgi:hypothetical protein
MNPEQIVKGKIRAGFHCDQCHTLVSTKERMLEQVPKLFSLINRLNHTLP